MTKANTRIPELDGLRGIAILLVISFHYINNQLVNNHGHISNIITKLTSFGWVGVDLFFVLSGFLIGNILIVNKRSPKYFTTFYVRRIVRIIPNYFLLLCIFGLLWMLSMFSGNYFFADHGSIPFWTYFLMVHNFFMAHYNSLGNRALSITWSIGIEEQFYLIFPFLVYFIRNKWVPFLLIFLIIGANLVRAMFNTWVPQYVLLPSRMDGLSLGFIVAYAYSHNYLSGYKSSLMIILWCSLLFLLSGCLFLYWKYDDLGIMKYTFFGLIFAILLIFALVYTNSWYAFILRNRILMWIGTISYSLYLFHYFILGLAYQLIGKTGIGIYTNTDIFVTLLAFFAAIAFSWSVYKLLEQPMVKFGKRWKY